MLKTFNPEGARDGYQSLVDFRKPADSLSIACQAVTARLGAVSTEVINMKETLSAGTYYLVS
jgi:hypothetical protein